MSATRSHRLAFPLILGLDVGTSTVRAGLADANGRVMPESVRAAPTGVASGPDGSSQAYPQALLRTILDVVDAALAGAGEWADRIAAVGVCSFVSNVLGVDASFAPVTPLSTYADTRSQTQALALKDSLPEEAVRQRTGCRFHPSYLPARLAWLRDTHPNAFSRATRFVSIGELLEHTLFGRTAVSTSVASWSGLLDRHRLVWDRELLAHLGLDADRFSPLTDASAPRRGLLPAFAARWPALAQVPWFPAIGDGAAANLGCGAASPAFAALTLGTSSAVRAVIPGRIDRISQSLWCYRLDARRSLPGGALSEGGCVTAWMLQTLRLSPRGTKRLDALVAALPPDGHGLTVLPFFAGERGPGWSGHAGAVIDGLTLGSTAPDILRAGMEAVALRLALMFSHLAPLLPPDCRILAGGGALRHWPAWRQILADTLGRDVTFVEVDEVSLRGTALFALESLGVLPDLALLPPPPGRALAPDPKAHAVYQAAAARQQALYDRLVPRPKEHEASAC